MAVQTGQVVGDYRLLDRIGMGSTGEVWRAQNVHAERMMRAIKVIRPELASDKATRDRFFKGVEILDSVRQENLMQVYAIRAAGDLLFMEMELLAGSSADKLLKDHPNGLGPAMASDLVRQALNGLAFMHKTNIIHGDLRPAKIFVADSGTVKVLEGGMAVADTPGAGMAEASPAYMAPEIAQGQPASTLSDVYSMGVVLFELLAGTTPFSVDRNLPAPQAAIAMMMQHATKPMPSLRDFRQDVSTRLDAIVRKAAAKAPDQRFASARDFELALLALADEVPTVREATPGPIEGRETRPSQPPVRLQPTPPPQPIVMVPAPEAAPTPPDPPPPPPPPPPPVPSTPPPTREVSLPPTPREATPRQESRTSAPPSDPDDFKTPPMGTPARTPGARAEPSFAMLSPVSGPPPSSLGRKSRAVDLNPNPAPMAPIARQTSAGIKPTYIIGGAIVIGAVVGLIAVKVMGSGGGNTGFAPTQPAATPPPAAAPPAAPAPAAPAPAAAAPVEAKPVEKPAAEERPIEPKAPPAVKPAAAEPEKTPEAAEAAKGEHHPAPPKKDKPVQLSEAAMAILNGKDDTHAPDEAQPKPADAPPKESAAEPPKEAAPAESEKPSDGPKPNIDVDKTIGKAAKLMEKGKAAQALKLYELVLEVNPTHTDALFGKALSLSEMHRSDDAIAAFKRTLEVNPRFGDAMMSLAEEYKKNGTAKLAIEYYQKYLDAYPSGPQAAQAQQGIDSLK